VAELILPLALILIAAELGAMLAHMARLPRVVGQIGAGLVIGPSLMGVVSDGEIIRFVAELGALAILGTAGLETNLEAMRKVGKPALMAAIGGVVLPFGLGFAVAQLFGLSMVAALFCGATLAATSVGITAATLQQLNLVNGTGGLTILGAAVIDDVLGLVVLALVVADAGSATSPLAVMLPMTITIVLAALALRHLSGHLHRVFDTFHGRGGGLALALGFVFLVAWAFEALGGLAAITGAYVAGLALAGSPMAENLKDGLVRAGEALCVPVFFVAIGLAADLRAVPPVLPLALALLAVAVIGKVIGSGLGARLGGLSGSDAGLVGWGMVGRGEVALVAATVGLQAGAIDDGVYAAVVLLAVVTTVIAPVGVTLWSRGLHLPSISPSMPALVPVRIPTLDGEQ
jgi:Kef-type K+ transport system membrane component KefB